MSDRELKIVEAMFSLMPEGPRMITYEDIVVKAWELYPDVFGLRGYSDRYPDASDIHKPLYNTLKSRGWVKGGAPGQKKFSLTASGWERAKSALSGEKEGGLPVRGRAFRATEEEIRHLEKTAAAALYLDGRQQEILDSDFFDFYRTSVRAHPQDFERRLSEVAMALVEALDRNLPSAPDLCTVDRYLRETFADLTKEKSARRKREV